MFSFSLLTCKTMATCFFCGGPSPGIGQTICNNCKYSPNTIHILGCQEIRGPDFGPYEITGNSTTRVKEQKIPIKKDIKKKIESEEPHIDTSKLAKDFNLWIKSFFNGKEVDEDLKATPKTAKAQVSRWWSELKEDRRKWKVGQYPALGYYIRKKK